MKPSLLLFLVCLLTACAASPSATPLAQPIQVQYTFATQPWLADLYACGGTLDLQTEQRAASFLDPASVDLVLRLGEPAGDGGLYEIGTEDIQVIVNPQNPIAALTAAQVLGLFSGQVSTWQSIGGADQPVEVWAFPEGEDIQQAFKQSVMGGTPLSTYARLASTPEGMLAGVAGNPGAVGILSSRLVTEAVLSAFNAVQVPVLVLTSDESQVGTDALITCLQK
jgi:hypothetical protein